MATITPDRPRTRAKKACLACNARRVRCNVLEMQPCRNCVAWNLSCELGVSRRGKYPRRKKKASTGTTDEPSSMPATGLVGQLTQHHTPQDRSSHYTPSTHPVRPENPIHKTVFLGESSPLTCVVDEGQRSPDKGYARGPQKGRLHYSISELRASVDSNEESLGQRRKSLQERLIQESALVFPSPTICEVLLQAYFEWFHPCFPIIDRAQVQNDYHDNTISPLLLQGMLFIGVSLCSDVALGATGFENRYQAKGLFYHRAKEIYDVGWEADTVIKLQSLFLLSFWRGGPTEERDVRYWLGAAIDLAQKKGMHVMSKLPFLRVRDQKLWKRIWWALYVSTSSLGDSISKLMKLEVRDQQTSAALGLPSRIRNEDCEVDELDELDFKENDPVNTSNIFKTPPSAHVSYVIGMAQLAKLCKTTPNDIQNQNKDHEAEILLLVRAVVCSQYLPGKSKLDNPSRPNLHQRLLDWEERLPPEMHFQPSMSRDVMFLVGMLHMAYNNLYVLLYRPMFLQPPNVSSSSDGNIALEAATRSTRILEDMLSENLVQHGSVHLITHTFSALCIHTIHFGRMTSTAKKLAEHRAKLCLLGLKELQKSWDLENWVLDLFFRCLDDRTARNLRLGDVGMPTSSLKEPQILEAAFAHAPGSPMTQPISPNPNTSGLATVQTTAQLDSNPVDEPSMNMDWYELFNVEGNDFVGLADTLTNPDYLNAQNLEFLYRFL
ncbi:hypothetical protein N7462_004247 [Penicillium macrosclerotiorum]|uniref:uncharacterized protein n=1 Tax=Penicillium macrosclerotiorum TaxID=303699 RepID=UPI002549B8DA|nr:uncharacterized protein N7462_004247 [Penicillium macrosclerotiorum]KAJ5689855.1 hypothetical protein N7462_004247 [Penicillium macrosclerotiorum]